MDAHDVGRARDGVGPALRASTGELTGVGITGGLLYGPEIMRSWRRQRRPLHGARLATRP